MGWLLPRALLASGPEAGEPALSAEGEAGRSIPAARLNNTDTPATSLPYEESILVLASPQGKTGTPVPDGPQMMIYCTHAGENYSGETRANGKPGGVMKAARALAEEMEKRGVEVIFDDTLHDSPSYSDAYASSLAAVSAVHAKYPDMELFIDVHRDSAIEGVNTRLSNSSGSYARLLLIVGSDEKYEHPRWSENQAFARQVYGELEELLPGLAREPRVSSNRYNQHIAPKALLVEVGSTDNSVEEARRSMTVLAQALCQAMGWAL